MRWSAVLIALVVASCAGCAPARAPDISGQITSLVDGAGRVTVLVEAMPGAAGMAKALVTVDRSTRVFHANSDVSGQLPFLLIGTTVSVWFDGPVAESHPVQARAGTLLIQTDATPLGVPRSAPSRAPKP
jgi:hypothetical protein